MKDLCNKYVLIELDDQKVVQSKTDATILKTREEVIATCLWCSEGKRCDKNIFDVLDFKSE